MKRQLFLMSALLPMAAVAQVFQALTPEQRLPLDSMHVCSYHQILPQQHYQQLTPDQLGPILGISVDAMLQQRFHKGKYFKTHGQMRFYADDETTSTTAAYLKRGRDVAYNTDTTLTTTFIRPLSSIAHDGDNAYAIYDINLSHYGKTVLQQRMLRWCVL